MREKVYRKQEKGITLIALIITIIVMLILVAVTVQITINGGIFEKAGEAVGKTKAAIENESNLDIDDLVHETITGITVEQVKDDKPGELETKEGEENTFIISSIEDLLAFAKNVTTGEDNYENKTVELKQSLDFASNKSYANPKSTDYEKYGYTKQEGKDLKTILTTGEGFKPIGITTNEADYETKSFKGTFDGNGKIINSLYIKKEVTDNTNDLIIGLFGNNCGTIQNLGINNCNISTTLTTSGSNTNANGGIAGRNFGTIDSCFVCGDISTSGKGTAKARIGGIVGDENGNCTYSNCYSNTKLNVSSENAIISSGGIVSGMSNGSKLENCYSMGQINVNCGLDDQVSSFDATVGGIVGYSKKSEVNNCYSINNIYVKTKNLNDSYIGGIGGNCSVANIKNCHNIGKIEFDSENLSKKVFIGYIAGSNYNNGVVDNCSYLKIGDYNGVGTNAGTDNSKAIEKESEMPSILSIVGDKFKEGKNGYPILRWQEE